MSPEPGLAESWETSEDGLTWTFHIRDDVMWSDGEPLTADDIAYTYNRILDGGPEAATWGSYLPASRRHRARRHDGRARAEEAERGAAAAADPDRARAHLEGRQRGRGQELRQRAQDGEPVVGSGPFRLVEGTAGGSTYRFEANPDYWQGAPHIDEVVFRVYKSEDPVVQALIKGEIDFVDDISAAPGRGARGRARASPPERRLAGLRRDRVQRRRRWTPRPASRSATATRRCRTRLPPRARLRDRPGRTRREGLPGRRHAGRHDHPAGVRGLALGAARGRGLHLRPGAGRAAARRGRLHDGRRRLAHDAGRHADRHAAAVRAARRRRRRSDTMEFFKEWLGDLGIEAEVERLRVATSSPTSSSRATFDAFQWGWYVEPDPTRCSAT